MYTIYYTTAAISDLRGGLDGLADPEDIPFDPETFESFESVLDPGARGAAKLKRVVTVAKPVARVLANLLISSATALRQAEAAPGDFNFNDALVRDARAADVNATIAGFVVSVGRARLWRNFANLQDTLQLEATPTLIRALAALLRGSPAGKAGAADQLLQEFSSFMRGFVAAYARLRFESNAPLNLNNAVAVLGILGDFAGVALTPEAVVFLKDSSVECAKPKSAISASALKNMTSEERAADVIAYGRNAGIAATAASAATT